MSHSGQPLHRATSLPSGEQHEIRSGPQHAIVTEVGATLRHYSVAGVDVVDGFDADTFAPSGRGQVLAPWPNRLDGGHYRFEGRDGQAALDEPALQNAIHGLVRWLPWRTAAKSADRVTLACILHPQPAYPWCLELDVSYGLDDNGLTVDVRATNRSDVPAPFGIGFHPYLTVGIAVDTAILQIPAAQQLLSDDRGLPTGCAPVAGSDVDFTTARPIGSQHLDTGFTGLERGPDGRAQAVIATPDGSRRVTLWVEPLFRYLMVYTGDTMKDVSRRRHAVAIEPMSCPPNAFRTGADLIKLAPGQVARGRWGVMPG